MARPDNRLQGFRKSMLKYQDAMTYSRALLSELPSRLKDGTGRILPLFQPELTAFFGALGAGDDHELGCGVRD